MCGCSGQGKAGEEKERGSQEEEERGKSLAQSDYFEAGTDFSPVGRKKTVTLAIFLASCLADRISASPSLLLNGRKAAQERNSGFAQRKIFEDSFTILEKESYIS